MKKFIPGRCHTYEGDKDTAQGALEEVVDMPEIPGFVDMEPMEQFIAQVDLCADCTTGCLKGLANVNVSILHFILHFFFTLSKINTNAVLLF